LSGALHRWLAHIYTDSGMAEAGAISEIRPMETLRILIADDHALIRRSLRSLLLTHSNWAVCGEAVDGQDAVDKARELRPDVVLLDVTMPGMTGLEATPIIRREVPDSQVVIVTQHDSVELSRRAAEVGAQGFVVKSEITRNLMPAIEAAGERQRLLRKNPKPASTTPKKPAIN
jgi:two-component system response regulator NreC